MQVKENQKQLLDDCRITAANDTPVDSFTAPPEKGHGRMETRSCQVFECNYATDAQWMPLIAQIIEIRRERSVFNTKTKCWEHSEETAFYVSTTRKPAEEYNRIIREHWLIENANHHVRDQTFHEDASRIRVNPAIFARIKSIAMNVLRHNNVQNIKQKLYENALNFNNIKKLAGVFY